MKTNINTIILVVIIAMLLKDNCVAIKEGFGKFTNCKSKNVYIDNELQGNCLDCQGVDEYDETYGALCKKYCHSTDGCPTMTYR